MVPPNRLISLTAEYELDALHGPVAALPGRDYTLSVNLGFQSDASGTTPDDFARFLEVAAGVTGEPLRFFVYKIEIGGDKVEATLLPKPQAETDHWDGPKNFEGALHRWLVLRSEGRWGLPIDEELIDYRGIAAPHLLDSVSAWDAPLPQLTGLTRLVRLKADTAFDPRSFVYLLVPWFGPGDPPKKIIGKLLDPDTRELRLPLVTAGGRINGLLTRPFVRREADPGSLIDDSTGFLRVRPRGNEIADALQRLRERGPSLLSTFTQLVALNWNDERVPGAPDLIELKRAIWLAVSGLITLFDPLMIALAMGGTSREGPFVSALIAEVENDNFGNPAYPDERFDTSGMATAITAALQQKVTPSDIAGLMREAFSLGPRPQPSDLKDQTTALPILLSLFQEYTSATLPDDVKERQQFRQRLGNTFDRQVVIELSRLAASLQDEAAMETAALRVLSHLRIDADWLTSKFTKPNSPGALQRSEAVHAKFVLLVRDRFNGLDATRMAQGALIEANLTAAAKAVSVEWDDHELKTSLKNSHWFAARLGMATGGTILPLSRPPAVLTEVDLGYLDLPHRDSLHAPAGQPSGLLDEALDNVLGDLFGDPTQRRFAPDSFPRTLSVQIPVDTDAAGKDTFQPRFNGVGVLVKRDAGNWCYANLADAHVDVPSTPPPSLAHFKGIVHPAQPVSVDEQRLLFIDYTGVPFASTAHGAPGVANGGPPFYTVEAPDYTVQPLPETERLPALAYGHEYSLAGHVVSKAGVLPSDLQRDARTPWLPKTMPTVPAAPGIVQTVVYQRRTAVGRVLLSEDVGAHVRIGVAIEGVQPLAGDYPRLVLTGSAAPGATLDILRNPDGTGAVTLPFASNDPAVVLRVSDLWWWSAKGTLTIQVLNRPDALPDDQLNVLRQFSVSSPFAGGSVVCRVESDAGDRVFQVGFSATRGAEPQLTEALRVKIDETSAGLGGRTPVWLRMGLSGNGATISFADPTAVQSARGASKSKNDSLLLLAGNDKDTWRSEVPTTHEAVLRFPRIGFLDFDRWLSNPAAAKEAFPLTPGESETDRRERIDKFHLKLMSAYLDRERDRSDLELAALLDSLPDLSVSGLQLELSLVDGLSGPPSELVTRTSKAVTRTEPLPFPRLGQRLVAADPDGRTMLKNLASNWGARVSFRTGHKLELEVDAQTTAGGLGWKIDVTVPEGLIARFSVRTKVPARHFEISGSQPAIFDRRVRELAVARDGDIYLFEGPSTTIEVMQNEPRKDDLTEGGWVALCGKTIEVVPAGRARSYNVVAHHTQHDETDAWHWRRLGSADVRTQRWRFMGRPIYNWLSPKASDRSTTAAVRIPQSKPGLEAFEREAFFDRDDQDSDTHTRQLDPGPAASLIQTFYWEPPSATIFRHRVSVRNRYAGALRPGVPTTMRGYGTPKDPPGSSYERWIRVALLADRTRVQLTRPQLRALIPLTTSPSSDGHEAAAPPVLAVLEEMPFAYGGLADRLTAEIRTGFGFGFKSAVSDQVHIHDSRKEMGPDPRLTYSPIPKEIAGKLTVEVEGPLGLTFDDPAAPAPRYVNTALLLRPRLADRAALASGALEEHFASVATRRYLDHRWTIDDRDTEDDTSVPLDEPYWIDMPPEVASIKAGDRVLLNVQKKNGALSVDLDPTFVDDLGPPNLPFVTIATLSTEFAERLALLHLPLEHGRASLAVFARPGSDGNTPPYIMASVEWRVPNGVTTLTCCKDNGAPVSVVARRTSASPATQTNWTRTGKAFDVLHKATENGYHQRVNVADLAVAVVNAETVRIIEVADRASIRILSPLERNPLFVQRHLAAISTAGAPGLGRTLESYLAVARIVGGDVKLALDNRAHAAVRVITFETPARPICFFTAAPAQESLTQFASAVFDVFAVVGDKYDDDRSRAPIGVGFTYRPLGTTMGKRELSALSFKVEIFLSGRGDSDPPTSKFTVKLDPTRLSEKIYFSIVGRRVEWAVAFTDGTESRGSYEHPTTLLDSATLVERVETIKITPEDFAPSEDYWGDISMLTIPPRGDWQSFSWSWLFTGRNLEAADAVSSTRLSSMPEAEARIIGISPPLPVIR